MNWTHIFIYILVAFTLPISALSDTEPLPDFNVLKKQAEEGDMESQFQLGRCYAFGTGTDKNGKQAALWFRKAAEQGHAKAQYNLGVAYTTALGVDHDDAEARKWFLKSAQQGFANAQFNMGLLEAKGTSGTRNMEQAFGWFLKAAEQGLPRAQFMTGFFYSSGEGCRKDHDEAMKWISKAAEQNDTEALLWLGDSYALNDDMKKAFSHWKKAADLNHPKALYILAQCYEQGNMVEQNERQAFELYRKAAELGHIQAMNALALYYLNGKGGIPKNPQLAISWLTKTAEQEDVYAQNLLGMGIYMGWEIFPRICNWGYNGHSERLVKGFLKLSHAPVVCISRAWELKKI